MSTFFSCEIMSYNFLNPLCLWDGLSILYEWFDLWQKKSYEMNLHFCYSLPPLWDVISSVKNVDNSGRVEKWDFSQWLLQVVFLEGPLQFKWWNYGHYKISITSKMNSTQQTAFLARGIKPTVTSFRGPKRPQKAVGRLSYVSENHGLL